MVVVADTHLLLHDGYVMITVNTLWPASMACLLKDFGSQENVVKAPVKQVIHHNDHGNPCGCVWLLCG